MTWTCGKWFSCYSCSDLIYAGTRQEIFFFASPGNGGLGIILQEQYTYFKKSVLISLTAPLRLGPEARRGSRVHFPSLTTLLGETLHPSVDTVHVFSALRCASLIIEKMFEMKLL